MPAHQDLEIVRGGVASEAELLLPLPDDLVTDRRRQAVAAETADGQIVAVVDQSRHRFRDRRQLVGQGPRLGGEEFTSFVGRGIGKKSSIATWKRIHDKGCW